MGEFEGQEGDVEEEGEGAELFCREICVFQDAHDGCGTWLAWDCLNCSILAMWLLIDSSSSSLGFLGIGFLTGIIDCLDVSIILNCDRCIQYFYSTYASSCPDIATNSNRTSTAQP